MKKLNQLVRISPVILTDACLTGIEGNECPREFSNFKPEFSVRWEQGEENTRNFPQHEDTATCQ